MEMGVEGKRRHQKIRPMRNIIRYSKANDHNLELVRQYQAGEERAISELLRLNERYIRSWAFRYRNTNVPFEELLAVARYGYVIGIQKFQESYGATVNGYAGDWVRSELGALVHYLMAQKRRMKYVSLEACSESSVWGLGIQVVHPRDYRRPSPEDLCLFKERFAQVQAYVDSLVEVERLVFCLYFGFANRSGPIGSPQIAKIIGKSRVTVCQIKERVLSRIGMTTEQFWMFMEGVNVFEGES